MIGWILKMFLKLLKPFAKIMIFEAILDALTNVAVDETTESENSSEEEDE